MKAQPRTVMSSDAATEQRRRLLLRRLLGPGMLLAVIACGVMTWVAVQVQLRRAERDALTQLKSVEDGRSFDVQLSNPFEPDAPPKLDVLFVGGPAWLTDWLGVDLFATVTKLQIYAPGNSFSYDTDDYGRLVIKRSYRSGVGADETRLLGSFANLEALTLEAHPVGDEIGPVLGQLPKLRMLNLANTAVTDAVLPHISHLKQLEYLNLSRTDITDDGLENLVGLRPQGVVNVAMTNVSEQGIERLHQQLPLWHVQH